MEPEPKSQINKKETFLKITRRVIKLLFVAITILVTAAGLLLCAFMLPPVQNWMRNVVKEKLESSLGVNVDLGQLVYFPFNTIGIGQLTIYGPDNEEMIDIASTRVNIGISSLWNDGLVINSISVDSLKADIHYLTDSTNTQLLNILALSGNDKDSSSVLQLTIGSFTVRHSEVLYSDPQHNNYHLGKIDVNISDIVITPDQKSLDIRKINALDLTHDNTRLGISGSLNLIGDTVNIPLLDARLGGIQFNISDAYFCTDESRKYKGFINKIVVDSETINRYLPSRQFAENLILNASGYIEGSKSSLDVNNLTITNSKQTFISANIHAHDLDRSDGKIPYIDIVCQNISSTFSDIGEMLSAEVNPVTSMAIGTISYEGRLVGTFNDLKSNGSFYSNIGKATMKLTLNTDGTATEMGLPADASLEGCLRSDGIDFSPITNNELGLVAFDTDVKWFLSENDDDKLESIYARIAGVISELTFRGYKYHDIRLEGLSSPSEDNGMLSLTDEDSNIVLVGRHNIEPSDEHHIAVVARVDNFHTGKTNITPNLDATLNLATSISATGNTVDDADIQLVVSGFTLSDSLRTAKADRLTIDVIADNNHNKEISLVSDNINATVKGQFKYAELWNELYRQVFNHTNALLDVRPDRHHANVDVDMQLTYDNAEQYIQFVSQELKFKDSGKIEAGLHTAADTSYINVDIGDIEYGDQNDRNSLLKMKKAQGTVSIGSNGINLVLQTNEMTIPHLGNVGKVNIHNLICHNEMTTDFKWDNHIRKNSGGDLKATTHFSRANNHLVTDIALDKSVITLRGNDWTLHNSNIEIGNEHLFVNNFLLDLNDRFISVNGRASASADDTLSIGMKKITIEDILPPDPYERYSLAGDINADLKCVEIYNKPVINGKVDIDRFYVDDDNLEHLDVDAHWSTEEQLLGVDVKIVTGGKTRAHGIGNIDSNNNHMAIDFDLDSLSIGFLNFYLNASVSNLKGTTTGKCQLHGPLNDIGFDAQLVVNKTDFKVLSTYVDYSFNGRDSVILTPDNMYFKRMSVIDPLGNVGYFDGTIQHDMFSNFRINIGFDVKDMLVMDMTPKENPTYYGKIYATGRLDVTGTASNTTLDIVATTCENTDFYILPNAQSDKGNANYIRFKQSDNKLDYTIDEDEHDVPDLSLEKVNNWVVANLDVHIDPSSKLSVVIDPRTENKIEARGTGDLSLIVGKAGDFEMSGLFTINDGKYNFTLENIINKQFEVAKGSTIVWDGDALNPIVDIKANYPVRASLYDLVQNSAEGQDLKKRVPINCNLFLADRLADPAIKFRIDVPSLTNSNQYIIDQYISTEEETNRQIFSLLALGRFYTSESATGTQNNMSSSNVAATTLSELITNQFSNWFSQNRYNLDIGVNYRPGDDVTDEEYELAMSTRLLNNKLVLSGNIGYGRNTNETNEGSVIGDIDIEMNIKGNLNAKLYTHSNNDIIYETSPTTQGVGITYREDFNSWKELINKYWNIITGKRRREEKAKAKLQESAPTTIDEKKPESDNSSTQD